MSAATADTGPVVEDRQQDDIGRVFALALQSPTYVIRRRSDGELAVGVAAYPPARSRAAKH